VSLRVSVAVGVAFVAAIGLASLADGPVAPGTRSHRAPVRGRRRAAGIAFALVVAGIALHLAGSATWVAIALDWLPGLYLLAGYWLPAQLPRQPAAALQAQLEAADRVLFESGFARFLDRAPRLFLEYLEAAYLCCYAIVPAGLAWMCLAGQRQEADAFWTAVLLAALPCYALVVWFETRPPRSFEPRPWTRPRRVTVRRLNLAILDRASTGLNTFPSGHAAASFAAALSVGAVMPAAGAVLGLLALSIAVGSVAGRYHYALDAACGALAAIAAFAVSRLV
jgi:hypothetical protein